MTRWMVPHLYLSTSPHENFFFFQNANKIEEKIHFMVDELNLYLDFSNVPKQLLYFSLKRVIEL